MIGPLPMLGLLLLAYLLDAASSATAFMFLSSGLSKSLVK